MGMVPSALLCLIALAGGCGGEERTAKAAAAVQRGAGLPAVEAGQGGRLRHGSDASNMTVVTLAAVQGIPLRMQIQAELVKAKKMGRRPYVELWATWCAACKALHAAMDDPRVREAFAGTYIMRLDVDQLGAEAVAEGYTSEGIPAFYEVDAAGRASGRMIDGGAWGDNTPEQIAGPLAAFFKG